MTTMNTLNCMLIPSSSVTKVLGPLRWTLNSKKKKWKENYLDCGQKI